MLTDYLLSGNVIGEYSFLTGKASHKTIVCETHVMIWFIRYQHLWKYIREMPGYRKDLLSTLQLKMWKVVAVKLAFRILLNEPSWFRMSRTEIMRELSEAVLVDLKTSHHSLAEFLCSSDVIVIQGTMVANGPNQIICGPFCIARGQTNYSFAEDSERPIILVMPPEVEDDYESKIQIGMWCTTDEEVGERTVSDLTLSSGTSNEQPSYKSRKVYFLCRDCAVRESHSSVSICSWVIGPETEV
ncbi:unnamed protein product [Lymnaea stagnalis]|uniref:Cyclic nucleotide-binding domain-containing protein n=1 Tax=Lymnaea stagnalis TaxID=6523 RepID=A0AAV2I3C8_LYMST